MSAFLIFVNRLFLNVPLALQEGFYFIPTPNELSSCVNLVPSYYQVANISVSIYIQSYTHTECSFCYFFLLLKVNTSADIVSYTLLSFVCIFHVWEFPNDSPGGKARNKHTRTMRCPRYRRNVLTPRWPSSSAIIHRHTSRWSSLPQLPFTKEKGKRK